MNSKNTRQAPKEGSHVKALTNKDREYLLTILSLATDFRQLSTEWKDCVGQGSTALKSARASVARAVADLTEVVDKVQEIVTRMKKSQQKLVATIERTATWGPMGHLITLKTQREAAILMAQEEASRIEQGIESEEDKDQSGEDESDDDGKEKGEGGAEEKEAEEEDKGPQGPDLSLGMIYKPSPFLLECTIPGTQATPLQLSGYTKHILEQSLDEYELKESILEALETIARLKDSGEDDLPPLLDQQLTNMVLLWELEPYLEAVPERNEAEGTLGVLSWQLEKMK